MTRRAAGADGASRLGRALGWIALAVVVIAAAMGASRISDAWSRWTTTLQTLAAGVTPQGVVGSPDDGEIPALLVMLEAEDGTTTSFTIVTAGPDGSPTLVIVPGSLYAILPGFGDFRISDAASFEDASFAELVVTNALGVRFDAFVSVDGPELQRIIGGTIPIELRRDFMVEEGGIAKLMAPAGRSVVDAATLSQVMLGHGDEDTLAQLDRQAAAWSAILDAARSTPDIAVRFAEAASDPEAASASLASAMTGANVTLLPVDRTGTGGDAEGFLLDDDTVDAFLAERLGNHMFGEPRTRVELLNGNGRLQGTRAVARELIRSGYQVVRTDNAPSFEHDSTIVVAQGRANTVAAQQIVVRLGIGSVELELRAPSRIVDVSIIVGQDAPDSEV